MEGEVVGRMQGLQGRGGWSGGSSGVVSWHDDRRNKMTSTRCSDPTRMYMFMHAQGSRPQDTTMRLQQQEYQGSKEMGDGKTLSNC